MTFANRMDDRQLQCQRRMLRLRILAVSQDAVTPARQAASIRDAANAVISEIEAMSRAVLASDAHKPGAETFLWVRITRLAMAADDAVNAARRGDLPALNAHLRHFDTLLTAIWTVQDTVYGQVPVNATRLTPGPVNTRSAWRPPTSALSAAVAKIAEGTFAATERDQRP